jgi:hypothetical protein
MTNDYGLDTLFAEEKTVDNFVRTNTEDEKLEIIENDPMEQKAEKQNKKVSNWVGTWNNPTMTDDEFHTFLLQLENDGYLQYAIFQREPGEQSNIEHFQFYINFKNARAFNWVKRHCLMAVISNLCIPLRSIVKVIAVNPKPVSAKFTKSANL